MTLFYGIDVGAKALNCVPLNGNYEVADCAVFDAGDVADTCRWMEGAGVVAIDAPAELSVGAHLNDPDPKLSSKFRRARCAEVALGRQHGYWVPWITPMSVDPGTWMAVGLVLHASVRAATKATVLEVYPHACFRMLAGGAALEKKSSVAGSARRVDLLRQRGITAQCLEMWSHDGLDAMVAAVTAVQHFAGEAIEVVCGTESGCEPDGSRMWLPTV